MNLTRQVPNLAAMEQCAERRVPRMVFDFIQGGAERETTLRRNESDFDRISFVPQPLTGTSTRDLSIELFGHRLSMPVLIAPTSLAGILWPHGEVAAANAALDAGTIYVMSHGATVTIEDLANREPGHKWFQLCMCRDRGLTRALADRARAAGYKALVLTIDSQVHGQRTRDLANDFLFPPRVRLADLIKTICYPGWLWRRLFGPRLSLANYRQDDASTETLDQFIAGLLDPTLNWRDVDWLRSIWSGPLLLKGVLHPAEARLAVEHGIDGLIVSNHGGRQLDGAISSIRALPAIVDEIGDHVPVLIDGGIRSGSDVVKALAFGARACMIGRPHLWGLGVAGASGVSHVLELFRREIDRVLTLGGWDGVAALDRGAVMLASSWRLSGQYGDRSAHPADSLFPASVDGSPRNLLAAPIEPARTYGLWRDG